MAQLVARELAADGVEADGENAIAVVDPSTNAVAQTVKVGTGPFVVTEIAGEAWVLSGKGTDIWRLKP
jgi:YVTN family beta-propeller protein